MKTLRVAAFLAIALAFASPSPLAFAQKAYIPNAGDNTVTVINTATDLPCTTSTCPASAYPLTVGNVPFDVVVSRDGSKAYIFDYGDSKICAITTATDAVSCMSSAISTVSGGSMMALTPDGAYIYVPGTDPNTFYPAFAVVDTSTMTEVTGSGFPIDVIGTGGAFYAVAVNPDSTKHQLYASDYNGGKIWVINTSTDTVTTSVSLPAPCSLCGATPSGIVFSPSGSVAYVADGQGAVDSINTTSNTAGAQATGVDNRSGLTQAGVAVSPDGVTVYASTYNSSGSKDAVQRIDFSQSPPVQLEIDFANLQGIYGMSLNPDGSKLYALRGDNKVQVVRTADNYQLYLAGLPWPISTGTSPFASGAFIVAPSSAPQAGSSSVTIVGNGNNISPTSGTCGDLTADWCTSPDPVNPLTSSSGTWPSQGMNDTNALLLYYSGYGIVETGAGVLLPNQIAVSGGAIGYTVQAFPCTNGGSLVTSGFPSGFANAVTYSGSAIFQATNNAFYSSTFSSAPATCWQVGPPTSGTATVLQWNAP